MASTTVRPRFAYFRGQIVPIDEAKVSIMTHALNYGTAVFGGLRGYWNAEQEEMFIFRPVDHFTRLKQSADILMMNVPESAETLRDILVALLRQENFREDVYIRPLAYMSEEGIGVRLHDVPNELSIWAMPFGRYVSKEEGLHIGTSSWRRVDDTSIPARGKVSGSYANSALIKSEALLNGFDEALVLNQDGHVSEASAANFFMYRKGKLITPPLSANILEGITRNTIITLVQEQMGIEVVEREIDRTEIFSADEAFLCGTGVQVAAITRLDHRNIGKGEMGPFVQQLRNVFFAAVKGRTPQYRAWLHPVFSTEAIPSR
jgi:branched-chain amino acid aminotransferase